MATIIRCINGHFYDRDKSKRCPICERETISNKLPGAPVFSADNYDDDKTEPAGPVSKPKNQPVLVGDKAMRKGVSGGSADTEGITVGLWSPRRGTGYVTGWIVGVKGPVKGKDYKIYHGRNYIGKDRDMDIVIVEGDSSIAFKNHCSIVYDGKGNQFYVTTENGMTFLNGEPLREAKQLQLGDIIGIGNCEFEFVPFCREGRTWKEEDDQE